MCCSIFIHCSFNHTHFFFIDPPLKFYAGLVGTAVAGAINILRFPGLGDAVGNAVKQGILWSFGDHKIDVGDFAKDVLAGLGMDAISKKIAAKASKNQKILKKVTAVASKIRGSSKTNLFSNKFVYYFENVLIVPGMIKQDRYRVVHIKLS